MPSSKASSTPRCASARWPPARPSSARCCSRCRCFHYYTAGFGLLQEITHRGVHLAFVLGLIFLVFPARKALLERAADHRWHAPGGVPLFDWVLAIAVAASVLYIPWVFEDLTFRVGNPSTLDVVMGSILIIALLEATRRSMGWPLPIIAIVLHGLRAGRADVPRAAQARRARAGASSSTTST